MYVRNFGNGRMWLYGQIKKITGPVSFVVRTVDGNVTRCQQDQLRHRYTDNPAVPPLTPQEDELIVSTHTRTRASTDITTPGVTPAIVEKEPTESQESSQSQVRSGTRVRKPPNRYEPDFT